MKFQIQREDLLIPLQKIIGAVEKRQTMPALSNILVKADNEKISLTATDLEIELVTTLGMVADEAGETTLPARKLLDICKALPEESNISITVDTDKALIKSGRSRFSLSTLPADDFPALESINTVAEFDLPQKTLKELIDKTAFAMALQDVRYYLNGLLLEVSSGLLRAVATDGHRLAYCEKQADCDLAEIKQVIVPRKGIQELVRLVDDSDQAIKILLGSNHIRAELGDIRFTSKLIDGRFPDYNRVIPDDGKNVITADRESLRQALVRASILSNEKYRGIRLIIENDVLQLQAQNPDQEEADVEVEIDYKGDSLEIGFNVNYMLDVLNVSDSSTVKAALRDSNSSCLMTYPEHPDCKYVIMPMRL
ncbi:MAG: DNA polymerase III subunit beta [Gammaproteobacteria bacterium]|jgi:DNA polymerase-3 subunit beta